MLFELESNCLEVVLVPASEQRHDGHRARAVQYANAAWYRKFCALYSSNRKGSKVRTRIKRRETIAALKRIIEGETKGVYVERILNFIDHENRKKNKFRATIRNH